MPFRWAIAAPEATQVRRLAAELDVNTLTAQCLVNRGFSASERAASFLEPRLKDLGDPFELPGLETAVRRLWEAHARGERVVLFGDYDVDGVSSTALLMEVLTALGWCVACYLPDRLGEGYGLSRAAVDNCLSETPCELFVAIDCGSTATVAIETIQAKGIDVIVLDHHQISDPAPRPLALVNPQLNAPGEKDSRELCSVGLAFKLAHGVIKRGREMGVSAAHEYDLRPLLDLVVLGTIADLVPLTEENRILASRGLQFLDTTRRPGLVALKELAGSRSPIRAYEVGFQLGPRLNAAGRLEDARAALQLLRAESETEAEALARSLDRRNRERQEIEQSITQEVSQAVRAKFRAEKDYVIVEGNPAWHVGVVGIVASRILRELYRPTLIIGGNGEHGHGSGRSIEGFDLAAALRECDDLLIKHGGHAMAAGVTIDPNKVDALRERLNRLARERLTPDQLTPVLHLDGEVSLKALSDAAVTDLERLQPHGEGNPKVLFMARGLRMVGEPRCIGRDERHLKFDVTDGEAVRSVIWWGGAEGEWPRSRFDLAFEPQINVFREQRSVQLRFLDWRVAS